MKLYTRTGDYGETSLFGGERVRKHHARVCAYGTVDEAMSAIGLAAATAGIPADIRHHLHAIMSDGLDIGSELATPAQNEKASQELVKRLDSRVDTNRIAQLEQLIDDLTEQLPPLTTFILPTGCELAARLHVARTMVRRAEREVFRLGDEGHPVRDELLHYLNRLSDVLFTLARYANIKNGYGDIPWHARKNA